jgi:mycothiol synthase
MAELTVLPDEQLSDEARAKILALCDRRGAQLGREALTDQAQRALRASAPGSWHLERRADGALERYGLIMAGPSGMDLEFLGDDLDVDLLTAAEDLSRAAAKPLAVWIHGARQIPAPPASGYEITRVVDRLHRALPALPAGPVPQPIELRTFVPGRDDEAFLALNARSFARHPDQGAMSAADLEAKMAEDWFDATGFFLAVRQAEVVGFCWTRVHDDPWGTCGEIYVIGVDPSTSEHGLGRFLLRVGLDSMVARGIADAMLYVEHDNEPAQGLYRSEGFDLEWHDLRFEAS